MHVYNTGEMGPYKSVFTVLCEKVQFLSKIVLIIYLLYIGVLVCWLLHIYIYYIYIYIYIYYTGEMDHKRASLMYFTSTIVGTIRKYKITEISHRSVVI